MLLKLVSTYKFTLRHPELHNIIHLLLSSLDLEDSLFPLTVHIVKKNEMTEITAVLERHSRVEVKWGVSRDRQTSSEVWEEERKSI